MIKTTTLASVYEAQGLKEDALKIYEEILKNDPTNKEAKDGINRLKKNKIKYTDVNMQMLDFFINMNSGVEYAEFERWLLFEN